MPGSVDARLLVFAKAPLAGRVKTRLARHYGARQAARLYRRMVAATLAQAAAAEPARLELWCAQGVSHPFLRRLARRHGARLRTQPPGDLGRRMGRALGERYPALVVGADCPTVDASMLREALNVLEAGADAVLGPAEDGGYALLGLGRPLPALFQAMPWGGPGVLRRTRGRLRRAGWRWHELPPVFDLDRPADLRRWRAAGPVTVNGP